MWQYFSRAITPLPTAKNASSVASVPQYTQNLGLPLLSFIELSVLRLPFIYCHFGKLPTSATTRDMTIIAAAITKNFVLLLTVITYSGHPRHKNVIVCSSIFKAGRNAIRF